MKKRLRDFEAPVFGLSALLHTVSDYQLLKLKSAYNTSANNTRLEVFEIDYRPHCEHLLSSGPKQISLLNAGGEQKVL